MSPQTAAAFSTPDSIQFAWTKTKEHLQPLLTLGFIGAILAGLNQSLSSGSRQGDFNLLGLFVQLVQVGVTMAWIRIALRIGDGQPVKVPSPSELFPQYLTFLLTSVISGLIIVAGLVMLVVPGILWALTFGFAGYVVLDRKLGPVEALKESARLTHGAKAELFGFAAALICLNMIGLLALVVGLFVTIPMTFIAAAQVYRRLQLRAGIPVVSQPTTPTMTRPPTIATSH